MLTSPILIVMLIAFHWLKHINPFAHTSIYTHFHSQFVSYFAVFAVIHVLIPRCRIHICSLLLSVCLHNLTSKMHLLLAIKREKNNLNDFHPIFSPNVRKTKNENPFLCPSESKMLENRTHNPSFHKCNPLCACVRLIRPKNTWKRWPKKRKQFAVQCNNHSLHSQR